MTEKTESLILELLKKIQKDQSDMNQNIQELIFQNGKHGIFYAFIP